jgi:hypothetical protein
MFCAFLLLLIFCVSKMLSITLEEMEELLEELLTESTKAINILPSREKK